MNPGKLDKRLTFQKPDKAQDAEGNWTTSYVDVFTTWGSINGVNALRPKEIMLAGALSVQSPKKITIRYKPNVTRDMRILYKGRVFDIKDIDNPEERNHELIILCDEVSLNG